MPRAERRRGAIAILSVAGIAVVAYFLDFITKELVLANIGEGRSVQVLGEFLQWTFVRNPGAAFSLASGMTWIFTLIALAVTVAIVVMAPRLRSWWWTLVFGALLGGVLGNLTDRLFREPGFAEGHVIDFIHFSFFPAIFNVADIFIVGSMGLFLILTMLGIELDGSRHRASDADDVAAAVDEVDAESTAEERA